MAENSVSQRYVVEKSCKFVNSFFVLVQNVKLLKELEVLSSPLSNDNSVS
jgi:hypothetical protein